MELRKSVKPINVYTVRELRDDLNSLIEKGLGDRIVLMPILNNGIELYEGDYVFIDKNKSFSAVDRAGGAVYLTELEPEDDSDAAELLGW